MDLNDPRLRLQVVQASSPSLRVAAAPKQNNQLLTVVGSKPNQAPQPAAPAPQPNFINDSIKNIGNFAAGSNEAFLGGSVREGAKALSFLTNGLNADKAKKSADNFTRSIGLGTEDQNSRLNDGTIAPAVDRTGTAFQIGQGVGQGQKIATDLATAVIPGAGAEKALTGAMKANEILQGAGLLDKAGRLILPAVGGGAVSSAILQGQDPTQNAGANFGQNAAIDAGVSLLGPAGSIAGRALNKTGVGSAVTDFLGKLGFGSKLKTTAKSLAEVNDEAGVQAGIQKILPNLDPQSASDLSKYVASETDPKTIEEVLKATKEAAGDTKATDKAPEAPANQLPPEDQAAIEAAGGKVTTPSTDELSKLAKNSLENDMTGVKPNSLELTKQELENGTTRTVKYRTLENGDTVLEDGRHLLQSAKDLGIPDVPAEDVTHLYKDPNAVTPEVDPAAVKQVEAAQTGTSDAPVANPEKTASPDVAQADIGAKVDSEAVNGVAPTQKDYSGQKLYHGSDEDGITAKTIEPGKKRVVDTTGAMGIKDGKQEFGNEVGFSITRDANRASDYGKNVSELYIKPGAKIATADDIPEVFKQFSDGKDFNQIDAVRIAKEKGFDGIDLHDFESQTSNPTKNQEIQIFNKDVLSDTPIKGNDTVTTEDAGHTLAHASSVDHPDVQDAIKKVIDSLPSAEKEFADKSKIVAKEKATRINQGGQNFDQAGGGEKGFQAKLGALKGKHAESKFQAIDASPETQKTILDNIEKSGLRDFEKLNTQNAVRKIWGANPEKPTPSDINYIRKYFGEDLGKAVEDAVSQDTKETGWKAVLKKIAATPRAAMATGDISGLGRQGAGLGATDAKAFAKNAKDSLAFFAKKENFDAAMTKIKNDDAYALINDKMKVALTGTSGNMEEAFAGENYAEDLPKWLGGGLVRGSDRSYAGLLTGLRFDAAKKVIDAAGGPDEYLKVMKNLYGDKSDDAIKAYGEAINTLSGRGGKQGGLIDKHMGTLSTTLFAPRLWAANVNKINPAWYISLARRNPDAAKLALRGEATHLAMAGTIMGLAVAAGAEVGFDPRSADFGKIKVGNTRYDILGGQLQNIVLASRLWTGEKTNSETGEQETLGDGITTPNRVDLLYQAFENKENPLLSFATRLMKTTDGDGGAFDLNRKDAYGNDFNLLAEGAKLVAPLGAQGIVDTTNDTGNIASGVAMNLPSFIGAGVQTYGSIATKDQGKDSNGKITFAGDVKPNMVTDNDGQVMLDAKGKPITVKVDKDATPTQIKALKDEARRSAYRQEFTRDQSKEDQSLMKLSSKELDQYVKDGTIDQNKADSIARLQKGAQTYGGNVDIPGAVTSDVAKNFYKTYNALDTKDQKTWLDGPADDNAKAVATQLNAQRASGLDEFKPSNKLSKTYADYEKDILSHPEYTNIDKLNKAKAVQVQATKLNYSTDQQDIYQEGPTDDLKSLLSSGGVQKSDLDQAIKMDDQLYASGLTGSLKFSKKFRTENGYNVPSKAGGSGSGSSTSTNAHLADYLPSASSAKSTPTPQFSSRSRSPKLNFGNVSTPKASTTKKVTINL